ncbi:hypothetical protein Syun_029712 [Stephania yunnanensis]|uniref:Uncharacterized protein n=1 Tax=Stephania yunnanensis TaxID=152371 RepID=A0AAP0E940_9MAGN
MSGTLTNQGKFSKNKEEGRLSFRGIKLGRSNQRVQHGTRGYDMIVGSIARLDSGVRGS